MGTVNALTAAATAAAIADTVTGGSVDGAGHLQLTTQGGDTLDAGLVAGPAGPAGPPGPPGSSGDAPAGAVMMFAATIPPTGWLNCDGSAVSRSTYASLFSAIGTVYGVGNGTTTFNLPDFRARVPRMDNPNLALVGGTAPTAHDHPLAGGTADAVAHVSFVTGPHPQIHMERISTPSYNSNFDVDDTGSGSNLAVVGNTSAHTNGAKVTGQSALNTVSSTPTNLLNPFLNINFIIKI